MDSGAEIEAKIKEALKGYIGDPVSPEKWAEMEREAEKRLAELGQTTHGRN